MKPRTDAYAPVAILMRYSVLQIPDSEGKGSWRLSRSRSLADYETALFARERLGQRLSTLQNVVLPSLLSQSHRLDPSRHRLIIFTSSKLPLYHEFELQQLVSPFPWIKVVAVSPDQRPAYAKEVTIFLKEAGMIGPLATVRLDDDDALCRTFLERLSPLVVSDNIGKVITFPEGYMGRYEHQSNTFRDIVEINAPFIALGLALISTFDGNTLTPPDRRTIFSLGNHARISQKGYPSISIGGFRAFLRSIYPEQDTGGRHELSGTEYVSLDRVERDFSLGKLGESEIPR